MTFGTTLEEQLMMAASIKMFYIAIDHKNKTYIEAIVSHINIEIHQLFSKQRIVGVRVTIVQWKISGNLIQSCF